MNGNTRFWFGRNMAVFFSNLLIKISFPVYRIRDNMPIFAQYFFLAGSWKEVLGTLHNGHFGQVHGKSNVCSALVGVRRSHHQHGSRMQPTQMTIDIHRMLLNVPGIFWLFLEHSMDKCAYLRTKACTQITIDIHRMSSECPWYVAGCNMVILWTWRFTEQENRIPDNHRYP